MPAAFQQTRGCAAAPLPRLWERGVWGLFSGQSVFAAARL